MINVLLRFSCKVLLKDKDGGVHVSLNIYFKLILVCYKAPFIVACYRSLQDNAAQRLYTIMNVLSIAIALCAIWYKNAFAIGVLYAAVMHLWLQEAIFIMTEVKRLAFISVSVYVQR